MGEQELIAPTDIGKSDLIAAKFERDIVDPKEIMNSFNGLVGFLGGQGIPGGYGQQTISQTYTMYLNLRWYLISNNRQLLSQSYVEHGIIQTLVDQPVDDAFRPGYDIKTDQLSPDQIEELEYFAEQHFVNQDIMQALKWQRLYGGGALICMNGQDPKTPLKPENLKEGEPFKFRAIDMWELYSAIENTNADQNLNLDETPEFFDYYGIKVHNSRVFLMKGKQAPSFIRPRLRGWGMSEVERLIRSLNSYLKNQDVIFELLDEAKVDVYKYKGMNTALLNADGTKMIAQRTQGANQIKNFQNAIVMDKEDEYDQKQMNFSGLGEMLLQIRQGVAADVKMPMTKLFGISAAGFNSGEDDIENYNSMIEGEIRNKCKFIIVQCLQICSQLKFGFVPDDLKIIWKSLRILPADQEEAVKTQQFNRTMSAYQSGLIPAREFKQAINKASLLPIDIEENDEAGEPIGDFLSGTSEKKVDA